MKKILLLMTMVLTCVGAWADVVFPTVGKFYTIKNLRSNKYATFAGDNTQLRQESTPGAKAIWYVTEVVALDGGGIKCKLHNFISDYVYAAYNSFTEEGVTTYIKENPYNAGYVCVSTTENLSSNCWDDQNNNTCIGNYNPRSNDYQGTSWTFEESDAELSLVSCSYELKNIFNEIYTGEYNCRMYNGEVASYPKNVEKANAELQDIEWEGNKLQATIVYPFPISNAETTNKMIIDGYAYNSLNMKIYAKNDTYIKVDKNLNPTADNITNSLWAIYPNYAEGTYTIKNIATNKFIYTEATSGSHNENTLSFNETATPFVLVKDSWGYSFKVADKSLYLSINSSGTDNEQSVGLHGNTHAGSSFEFIPYLLKYTLTDAANNTFTGEYESWAGWETAPTFTGAEGCTLTNKTWNADANTLSATITFTVPVSSQTIVNPVLVRQGSWNFAAKKWCAVKEDGIYNVKVKTNTKNEEAVPELGLWQWVIYPKFKNGNFTFNIMNAATGTFVYANPENGASAGGSKGYITLNNTGTDFTIINNSNHPNFAYINKNEATLKLTINSENDTDVYLGAYTGTHNGNNISFPNLTSFNVKVGSTGYASLYTPITGSFDATSGVETYAITEEGLNDGFVTLTQKEGVAANQGVIIKANEGTYTFTAGTVDTDWTDNLLTGTSVNTMVEGEAYVLGNVDGIGLYKAKLTDGYFLNNAGKAYLKLPTASPVKAFLFEESETTDIEESVVAPSFGSNAPVYDLCGRRVVNTVKGGIYIQNGKKFIVK